MRTLFAFCAALLLSSTTPVAALTPQARFETANQLYFKGEWGPAAEAYSALVSDFKLEDPVLYHNLGNAYFRSGAYGSAILYYRRAQQLAPSADLARALDANLDAARRTLQARHRSAQDANLNYQAPHTPLYALTHLLEEKTYAWALLTSVLVCFGLLVTNQLRGYSRKRTQLSVISGVFAAILALGGYGRILTERDLRLAIVVSPEAHLRDGKHKLAQGSPLLEGLEVRFLEDQGEWSQVELSNGRRGWVEADHLREI